MAAEGQTTCALLAEHDARHTPEALLDRYARGRVRHFYARQVATVIGAASLAVFNAPWVGLLVAALALLGEFADCAVLRAVPRLRASGWSQARIARLTALTAGLQAMMIAACVMIAMITSPPGVATMFSTAFLAGGVHNAAVVYIFHPRAAQLRLAIYAATGLVILALTVFNHPPPRGFDFLGVLTAIVLTAGVLRPMIRSQQRQIRDSRALLERSALLETANRDLEDSQKEARRLSLIARYANDSIIVSDADRRILWVNAAFTRLTGYTFDEALGRTPMELFDGPESDPTAPDQIIEAMKAGRPCLIEVINYTKDGRKLIVETNLVPVRDRGGAIDMIIGIERDVTEVREQARELAAARDRAEEGARAKSAFLATMSHEIRTPMNGIIGMADILADASLGEEERGHALTIRESAEALLNIINDILDYSKLEADKMRIVDEVFSPAACIRAAADVLRPQALGKGLYLDMTFETTVPTEARGDSGRLRQILINMLGNAVKFTDSGGVTMRIRVTSNADRHQMDIRVEDTGIGVSESVADRIFEQFEQADPETTRRFGGTGLGLSISRALARRMGGDLTLEASSGKGASFRLTLPLAAADKSDTPLPATTDAAPELAPVDVLLADDNRTNRALVERFLRDQPVRLRSVANGREAVDLASGDPPDVILMDLSMPELGGIDAAREIRAGGGPQPHIIALTANAFGSDRDACRAAGMDDFLTKPLRKADLIAALARAEAGEKPLGRGLSDAVSGGATANEAPNWTSPPASGTTSGRSIRSSGR